MLSSPKQTANGSSAAINDKRARKALDLILESGTRHRYDIMNHLGLSLEQMTPFNSYLEYALRETAEYDKKTKEWSAKVAE